VYEASQRLARHRGRPCKANEALVPVGPVTVHPKYSRENGIDTDKGDVGELADYELPASDTWSRQLRNARKPLGEQKYTRRAGRAAGRSIVAGKEIEYQRGGDG
jgi:hypothetical protein